mmetsp:Transcript_27399/g.35592  ORF Transcript_27399/g.35592 Transcript_27399/m.35592 type:complete len:81 (+) Transcript_27399:507-749(+)
MSSMNIKQFDICVHELNSLNTRKHPNSQFQRDMSRFTSLKQQIKVGLAEIIHVTNISIEYIERANIGTDLILLFSRNHQH